jgi:hypothetical protein
MSELDQHTGCEHPFEVKLVRIYLFRCPKCGFMKRIGAEDDWIEIEDAEEVHEIEQN